MDVYAVTAVILCALLAGMVSHRVQNTIFTLPMIFSGFGILLGGLGLNLIQLDLESEVIKIIAELTLVFVLSTDASRIDVRRLRQDHTLPLRLLGIGLPLTMILGTVVALGMFPQLPFWEAAIIAIVLTPTDASLGMAVVTNPRVPVRIRQSLNIESGLNDGIAVPFLLLAISFAALEAAGNHGYWIRFGLEQIVFGAVVGIVIGYLGTQWIDLGRKKRWMSLEFQKLSSLLIPILVYILADFVGGNGFIAAFCSGVVVGNIRKWDEQDELLHEFLEVPVHGLMMITFMIVFGAVMLPLAVDNVDGKIVLYAVLSLTVIRMLPVAISMLGAGVNSITVLFLGWFGPRGVASILYIFTVIETEGVLTKDSIYDLVLVTVLLSIILHGITAVPGANFYSKRLAQRIGNDGVELTSVPEMPVRAHPKSLK